MLPSGVAYFLCTGFFMCPIGNLVFAGTRPCPWNITAVSDTTFTISSGKSSMVVTPGVRAPPSLSAVIAPSMFRGDEFRIIDEPGLVYAGKLRLTTGLELGIDPQSNLVTYITGTAPDWAVTYV